MQKIFRNVKKIFIYIKDAIIILINKIIEFIYPAECVFCKDILSGDSILCCNCWKKLNIISEPFCNKCGKPFSVNTFEVFTCLFCIKNPPAYLNQRILLKFNPISRKLIHNFKYYDMLHYGKYFAKLMFFSYVNKMNFDIIVPAPMHKMRRIFRMYNQVDVLAKYLSQHCNKTVINNVLLKSKNTKQQSLLTNKQRKTNLNNSFYIENKHLIKDKNILLLDDVITTGTTIKLCVDALLRNGAKSVIVSAIFYV